MMNNEINYDIVAKETTRNILNDYGIGFIQLENRFKDIGLSETSVNLSNKINRGSFSFAFFLQILKALNKKMVIVESLNEQETITKEQFVEHWLEISKQFRATDADEIWKMLEKVMDSLYRKAGFTEVMIDEIHNRDYDDFNVFNDDVSAELVGKYYDELVLENQVAINAVRLQEKIARL